jgi:hypothetical protein
MGEWMMFLIRLRLLHLCIMYTPVSSCIYKQAIKTFNKWASWCETKYKRKRHCHCGIFGIGSAGSVKGEVGLMAESTGQYNHYTNLLTAVSCALVTCAVSPQHHAGDNETDAVGVMQKALLFPSFISFSLTLFFPHSLRSLSFFLSPL